MSLVDGCLRQRKHQRREQTQESNQDQRAFVTPHNIQIFEQQAGTGLLDGGRVRRIDILRARQRSALAIISLQRLGEGAF